MNRYEKVPPAKPAWLKIAARSARRVARLGQRLGVDVQNTDTIEQLDEMLGQIALSSCEPVEGASYSTSSNDQAELARQEAWARGMTRAELVGQQQLPAQWKRLSRRGANSRILVMLGSGATFPIHDKGALVTVTAPGV